MHVIAASYLQTAIKNPQYVTDVAKKHLIPNFRRLAVRKKTTLVGTGLSGALGVVTLAYEFGFRYAVLRKRGENCHAWAFKHIKNEDMHFEGVFVQNGNWVFVDDCIDSGATARRVKEAVNKLALLDQIGLESIRLTYAGSFLYNAPVHFFASDVDIWRGLPKSF